MPGMAHTNVDHSRFNLLDNSRDCPGIAVEQFIISDGWPSHCFIHHRIEAIAESANDFRRLPALRCFFHEFLTVV